MAITLGRSLAASALISLSINASGQVLSRPDRFGDAMQFLLPAAAAALSLRNDDMDGLKQFGLSVLVSQGTTEVLKQAVNSRRPDGTGKGFPSGHTSIAFVSAAYVDQRYGHEWGLPMYGLATLAAYSRVATHHHFAKDVVGGAAVGVASAYLFTHPISEHSRAMIGIGEVGLRVGFRTEW